MWSPKRLCACYKVWQICLSRQSVCDCCSHGSLVSFYFHYPSISRTASFTGTASHRDKRQPTWGWLVMSCPTKDKRKGKLWSQGAGGKQNKFPELSQSYNHHGWKKLKAASLFSLSEYEFADHLTGRSVFKCWKRLQMVTSPNFSFEFIVATAHLHETQWPGETIILKDCLNSSASTQSEDSISSKINN